MEVSNERKAAIIKKLLPPLNISVPVLARQEGIPKSTLYTWRNQLKQSGEFMQDNRTTRNKWSAEKKFMVVVETASLTESELSEYCRKIGLYPTDVKQWRAGCINGNAVQAAKDTSSEIKDYKAQIKKLEKELAYKEKALAETAALLVLRKKLNALREADGEEA